MCNNRNKHSLNILIETFYSPPGRNQRTTSNTVGPGIALNGFAFSHSTSFLISAVMAADEIDEEKCTSDLVVYNICHDFGTTHFFINIFVFDYIVVFFTNLSIF